MTGDESSPPIPLSERVCITLMSAGIAGPDGGHPQCMGSRCAKHENCQYDIVAAALELDVIKRHPRHRRVTSGKGWGEDHR